MSDPVDGTPAKPTPDQCAAHEFLSELRTRITTQPLPYQYGVESRELESLWEVFGQAREAMKKNPRCEEFANKVTDMLNVDVRPFTAKWHRAHAEGVLASRDGADAFRGELQGVQLRLRHFAESTLKPMAYPLTLAKADQLTPDVFTPGQLATLFDDVPFGIGRGPNPPDRHAEIDATELAAVTARRKAAKLSAPAGHNAIGLAFSGGGIRSATFCLGVAQVLAEKGLLKEVDFLSTVSGGGYTGSFLSRRLGAVGATEADVAKPHGPDPPAVAYLRHHARYLNPISFIDQMGMVISTVAGMLLNLMVPIVLVIAAALAVNPVEGFLAEHWKPGLTVSIVATAVALFVYSGLLRLGRQHTRVGLWILGLCAGLAAFFGSYPLLLHALPSIERETLKQIHNLGSILVTSAGGLVAILLIVFRFFSREKGANKRPILTILLLAAGLVVPLLFLVTFSWAYRLSLLPGARLPLALIGLGFAIASTFLLNVNLTAPHRIYRDRLAATFVETRPKEEDVRLQDLNPGGLAPYHLLNATVNLPDSDQTALRDRKCDFFLFSKGWSGSRVVDYRPTSEWKANGKPVDLATAMAVCGAAASPRMGLMTFPGLSALMTLLNVRMGFWMHRPGCKSWFEAPGLWCLVKEMTGIQMSETAKWLNLSDGGHIENLGAYELLRRRCKLIVAVDAEADPDYGFGALMTVIRHAQLDFGVDIKPTMSELSPDPKTGLSRAHGTLCRIHYPAWNDTPKSTGLLLYLKASMTGNEPQLVQRYRAKEPSFPHQSTADQFFDEEQFEAYRELGVHVAESQFLPALMGGTKPKTVREWFERLAGSLLEPEAS